MDFGGPPVGTSVNPVGQGLTTLSELMNVKRSQQALQTGQYQQQTAAAQAQQEQQTASQRQAAAQFFQSYDIAKHVGPDGTIDLDQALTNPQLKATGDAYPEIAKSIIGIKNAQLDAKQKLSTLDSGLRQDFYQNVGGLSNDPDVKAGNNQGVGKVLDAIDEFGKSGGPDAARVAGVYRPLIQNLVQSGKQERLPEMLSNFQLQALDAGKQREQTYGTPTTVNTGAVIQPGVQAPAAAGGGFAPGGAAIPLPPQQTTNASGQIINRNPQTGALSTAPVNGTPGAVNPTTAQAQTQQGIAAGVTQRVQQAQAAANNTVQAQDALNRARTILDSPNSPNTGALVDWKRNVKNFLSSAGIDTQGADDTNSLVKNLARYEASRATQAGLGGTDAARELAHNGSPNVSIDNAALKGIVTQSLATEKALSAYANVQSKTKDANTLAKNEADFRNIPNLVQGYEYGLARNSKEAEEFLSKHGLSRADMAKTRALIKEFESRSQ
jgi:hypothetical protein